MKLGVLSAVTPPLTVDTGYGAKAASVPRLLTSLACQISPIKVKVANKMVSCLSKAIIDATKTQEGQEALECKGTCKKWMHH